MGSSGYAQDTLTVQTFNWSSQTRDQVFEFPSDSSATYSKILMTYNMRCHDNQVGSGNVGCREWDYSCNTFITDSSRMDSLLRFHPTHLISGFTGDTFNYVSDPVYDYTVYNRMKTTLDTAYSVRSVKTLSSNEEVEIFNSNQAAYQYILTAEELMDAGLQEGEIVAMELPFELGDFMSMSFRVNLKHTDRESLTPNTPIGGGWKEVYFDELIVNNAGMNVLYFHTPFDWNGQANLAVEIVFNDKMTPTNERLLGENGAGKAIIVNSEDHIFALNGAQYFQPDPRDFREVEDEITIMAWLWGSPEDLPANTYLLEGVDDNDRRQVNLHLPWGNGQVYWDCGSDGTGYDRINKEANPQDFAGQWNHWAFTKNAVSGEMKIFLNGQLWHSGAGKHKKIDLQKLNIGKGYNSNSAWSGWINELSVWQRALDRSEIYDAMMNPLERHASYDDVLLYFPFEEVRGRKVTNVKNNQDYDIIGSPFWRILRAEDLYFDYREVEARPAVSLIQGNIEITTSDHPYVDSAMVPPRWIRPFHVENNRDVVEDAPIYLWRSGEYFTRNDKGEIVDTVLYPPDGQIVIGELRYFDFSPSKFEILSLVTPYGNGLSLGEEGVTFTFDVTDFAPILKGKKRMSIEMGGQWQEELDIRFHFIEGTPPRDVLDIQNIWRFQRGGYGNIQSDRSIEERQLELRDDASYYKIRSSITGHGQNGEFQPRNHYINLDGGQQDFVFQVWKECSTIPIYPQGGTWLFDRAGWCPGDPTKLFEHDITDLVSPGGRVSIDYGVNGAHLDQANYLVSHQLVSYGPFNRQIDAAVEHVIRPSQNIEWARENPSCNTPTIVIKNYGEQTISSALLQYGVRGGSSEEYLWSGELHSFEEATVVLPVADPDFWNAAEDDSEGIFEVRILEVNNMPGDDEDNNNMRSSPFTVPEYLPGPLQLEFVTNNVGSETSYRLLDHAGQVLHEGDNFASNSKYVIDLDLAPGCYSLEFEDSGDDGLYYWFWEQTGQNRGRGYLRFNRLFNGRPIGVKAFESEFGRYIHYDFRVEGATANSDPRVLQRLMVHPNPTNGRLNIEFFSQSGDRLNVRVRDAYGREVMNDEFDVNADQTLREQLDLGGQAEGMYFVTFTQDDKTTTRTVMLSR
ncbi:MAG: LamG-like jellyroll fold domain-containing protein [Saprospiraceae bacterium]|nr:LamG-like jellyroll fold domain-containing protein [Saprospiraceae bacterium]